MLRRVTAAAVAVVALAACSTPAPSLVYDVQGRRLTQQQLSDQTAACASSLGTDPILLRPRLALWQVRGAIADEIAARRGLTLDPAQVARVIDHASLQTWLADPACRTAVQAGARFDLLVTRLGAAQVIADARDLGVVATPIYGAWNTQTVSWDGTGGSLSSPYEGP